MHYLFKAYPSTAFDGTPVIIKASFDRDGVRLKRILSMPKKRPISYFAAENMYWDWFADYWNAGEVPPISDMITWISEEGFHIELKGDEYEMTSLDAFVDPFAE